MLELHGWLTISETYKDEDKYTNEALKDIMRQVNRIIENSGTQLTLQYMNGTPFLTALLYANHRTKETDTIIETYKSIAKTATGSYGMIYLRDDEDTKHYNEFQLFIWLNHRIRLILYQNWKYSQPTDDLGSNGKTIPK